MKNIPEIFLSICEFMKTEYTQRLSRILMKMYHKKIRRFSVKSFLNDIKDVFTYLGELHFKKLFHSFEVVFLTSC